VERSEKYFELLRERGKIKGQVSHELHHMITSAYFTGVFETVVHDMTRDKAMKYIEELARFFNSGWDGISEFL
jgi:transcriptional regulator, TetR family